MAANVTVNIEMAGSLKRIAEYINSGFPEIPSEKIKELNKKDWARIRSKLIPGSRLSVQTAIGKIVNSDDNFSESLKWMADYIYSGYDEGYLKTYYNYTLNKCAVITRILDSADENPAPLRLLSLKSKKIFNKVLNNNVFRRDEHQEVSSEVFFETNYSPEKIKEILKEWNPVMAKFSTFLYRNMLHKMGTLIKRTESQVSFENGGLERAGGLTDDPEENIRIDLCRNLLIELLLLTDIRPHKKLFFLITDTIYMGEKNIDAAGFYKENNGLRLEQVYFKIYENTGFWEIRKLLDKFYNDMFPLLIGQIYESDREEDKNILELAAELPVKDTLVNIYFTDCIMNGETDDTKITQRLSSWNLQIKKAMRKKIKPVIRNSNFFI